MKIKRIVAALSLSTFIVFVPSSNAFAESNTYDQLTQYEIVEKDLTTGIEHIKTINLDNDLKETSYHSGENVINSGGNIVEDFIDNRITPYSIIGEDDAYNIVDTYLDPYRAVCHLTTYWDTDNDGYYDIVSGGTGFMVEQRILFTNAHVIYNTERGGYCDKVEVAPARNQYMTPYGPYTADKVFIVKDYYEKPDEWDDYDFGMIVLNNKNVGNKTGWFGLKPYATDLVGTDVSLVGYPQDRDPKRHTMWRSDGKVTYQYEKTIAHNCDTLPGNSGSPVFNSDNQVVAIHNAGGTTQNYAVLLTNPVIGLFKYLVCTYQ